MKYLICLIILTSILSAARKPNIILMMADDVGWESFGCYGSDDYKTPNLDKLASEGIRFSHCYSTPICTTSRVKIMTGQYNFRNYTHFGYLNPKDKTIGNLMREAGYKTAIAGKWQLNGLYNKSVFADHLDAKRPNKAGFDEYSLWQLIKTKADGGERFWDPCITENGVTTSPKDNKGKYGPDIMSDFLCRFIEKNKDESFFIYYPTVLVHNPFLPTPASLNGKPYAAKGKGKTKGSAKENFGHMMFYMDLIVGKLLKKVEEIGQMDNTIFLFTADNGTNKAITSKWKGQMIKGGKADMTDMGTHVPLIAYWKGHTPKGVVLDDLIDFTDFYPTLAEITGLKRGPKDPIDGRSFYAQLNGKKAKPREWVLCYYNCYWNKAPGLFIRNQDYKLYQSGKYFNVPKDLNEKTDITKGAHGEKAETIRKKLQLVMKKCPTVSTKKEGSNAKNRPVYPDNVRLIEPGD
jgi:arylsulfatase A